LTSLLPVHAVKPKVPVRGRVHSRRAAAATVESPAVSGLVKLVDIRERPWETLQDAYQLEARRCWAERSDGKVRGFIANLLPGALAEEAEMSPFEIASLRRTWRPAEKVEEKEGLSYQEGWVSDPYEVLGVSRNSTTAEIKKAYLSKARECHPDKEGGDPELFQEVLLAYRILRDEGRKDHYDSTGRDSGDEKRDAVYVRVPGLEVLRKGMLEHDELYLAPGYELMADQVGTVQFDYPERLLTQAVFDLGEKGVLAAWLPRQILTIVDENGKAEPVSDDNWQQSGLVLRAKENKLMKMEMAKQRQYIALAEYLAGWHGVPPPVRDVGHAHGFFKRGRENDDGVVLDLGCGSGLATTLLTKGHFSVVFGLDNNRTALFEAREGAEMESLGPQQGLYLIRADAHQLPFRDQQVDNVWWGFGWHSVERPADVLRDVLRVLKPGGRLAVATEKGYKLAVEIRAELEAAGFEATSVYPPRHGVFLNYASKPE